MSFVGLLTGGFDGTFPWAFSTIFYGFGLRTQQPFSSAVSCFWMGKGGKWGELAAKKRLKAKISDSW